MIPALDVGGAEMDLVRNLPRLDRRRFRVVVCPLRGGGPLTARLIEDGIEVLSMDSASIPSAAWPALNAAPYRASVWRYLRLARRVARELRAGDFEVVHAILPSAYVIAALANLLAGGRALVMSRLSLSWYQKDYWLLHTLERVVLHRRCHLAIGNSNAILWELRQEGITDDKAVLIHNGIDARAFRDAMGERDTAREQLGVAPDVLVFSAVANLFAYKGHEDLLHALAMAKDRLPPNWRLLAAGRDQNGNLAKLNRMAGELGLSQHVRFLGQQLDTGTILSAADIHVSASHHEGFPNNILEAMAAGLPVVATAVGGVPELISDELTGQLVPPHEPRELAEALLLLARDRGRRLAMGRAARRRVELHFPIERSVAAFADAYTRAAAARVGAVGVSGARAAGL